MTFPVPGIVIAGAIISVAIFYYINQKGTLRRHNRRADIEDKQEALLELLRKRKAHEEAEKDKPAS